jgi:S1-C subfamily serine protease
MTEQNGRARNGSGPASPLEAAFGRPPGVESSFAPGAPPVPAPEPPPPPPAPGLRRMFGRPSGLSESFDPPPGAIKDATPPPESPWWKPDADRDPWRDARSPASLGAPPDFGDGRPAPVGPPEEENAAAGRGRRWGLRNITLTAALVLLLAGLLTGIAGGVVGYLAADRITPALLDPDATLSQVSPSVQRPPGSVADIAKRVLPVVVSVEVSTTGGSGTGSGVVVDGNGYVLTNNHVVSQFAAGSGSGTLRVRFSDQSAVDARIAGRDPKTDLAVLKIQKPGLTVASLGDSSKVAVGDPVIAIGSPLGLAGTVTSGIISALDRPVRLGGEGGNSGGDTNAVINAIQTDASINPGNSGGALVDGSGAVIGINSAIATLSTGTSGQAGSIGLGFAIPINEARQIAQQLIRTGKVRHATLGVTARSVTDGARDGALVESVAAGSAAADAGIKAGDVITRVGSRLVGGSDDLVVQIRSHGVGEKVQLTYVRGGRTVKVTATLQGD